MNEGKELSSPGRFFYSSCLFLSPFPTMNFLSRWYEKEGKKIQRGTKNTFFVVWLRKFFSRLIKKNCGARYLAEPKEDFFHDNSAADVDFFPLNTKKKSTC